MKKASLQIMSNHITPEILTPASGDENVENVLQNHQASTAFENSEGKGDSILSSTRDFRIKTKIKPPESALSDKRNFRQRGPFYSKPEKEEEVRSNNLSENSFPYHQSKIFEKNTKLVSNLPEDPRISKLLRRLCAETDIEKSLIICSKLQEAVVFPENTKYIRRSYDILVESLLDVFYNAPGFEIKEQASVVLGRIGYVMGPEFKRHLDWMRMQLSLKNAAVKPNLIDSLSETFRLEKEHPCLADFVSVTMALLQSIFDVTDSPEVFISSLNAIVVLAKSYPDEFAKHFVNTVDILVGWHVDVTQSKKIREFCAKTLLKMSRHWQADINFSTNLLSQFVEDMVAYSNDLPETKDSNEITDEKAECIQRITSFINVSNAVIKSLGIYLSPSVSSTVTWIALGETLNKVLNVIIKVLNIKFDYDLLLAGNDCVVLFLSILQIKMPASSLNLIFQLVDKEMEHLAKCADFVKLSITSLISKTVKEVSTNLTVDFIRKIIAVDSNLRKLRMTENDAVLKSVLNVYSCLLNVKNIPLLQEAYKCILADMQLNFTSLGINVSITTIHIDECAPVECAEKLCIFYLQCLSELANASNSIIGMWALQPSILHLLAIDIQPDQEILRVKYPFLQYAILYLLFSHAKKNNYFIASSDFVSNSQGRANMCDILGISKLNLNEMSSASPTSGHFNIILNLLNDLLTVPLPLKTLELILIWTHDVIMQLSQYLPIINHSKPISQLIIAVLSLGTHYDTNTIKHVALNLKEVVRVRNFCWNMSILNQVASICLVHIDNKNKDISSTFHHILLAIPWDITHLQIDKYLCQKYQSTRETYEISMASKLNTLREYMNKGSFSPLSNHHFSIIMNKMLFQRDCENFATIFEHYWPLIASEKEDLNIDFFRYMSQNFDSTQIAFLLSECALQCVNLKLRTPLGKPQDTFTSIESSLKAIARKISGKHNVDACHSVQSSTMLEYQENSRWIIEFLQFLENYIYNAAEGTALTLPLLNKQVKTFFRTNWPTCRDWFTRIRPAAIAVSQYGGHSPAVYYHVQMLLLAATRASMNLDVNTILQTAAKCLIKMNEPEVIHGLYTWVKNNLNIKLPWLKAAAEQANSRYEIAIQIYSKQITDLTSDGENMENEYLIDEMRNCLKNTQSWDELSKRTNSNLENDSQQFWNSYSAFDLDMGLGDWNGLENIKSNSIDKDCSYSELLENVEYEIMNLAVCWSQYSNGTGEHILNECQSILKKCMKEFTREVSPYYLKQVNILELACHGLIQLSTSDRNPVNPFRPSIAKLCSVGINLVDHGRIAWWCKYFTKLYPTQENIFYSECLSLELVKSARKQGNIEWSRREISQYFRKNAAFQSYLSKWTDLSEVCNIVTHSSNMYEYDFWTINNTIALKEICKILYTEDGSKHAAINACANISLNVSQRLAVVEQNYELREKGTRLLLTLAKWVQNENDEILLNNIESPLAKLISALPEIGLVDNNISANVIPLTDTAVGKLLQFSVNQCPALAKSWSNFASWCFRWGRKMVEYSSKTGDQLTENDKIQIENVMIGCTPQDFEAVCEILSKTKATCDDEDIDWNEINTSEMIETQLRSVRSLTNAFPEHISLLVDIWRQAQKRVFSYYELSADAYFKFLQLICSSDFINHSGEYAVVSATLRLLRLIVKHAMELQTVLETGLANTPTHPWKVIIPQLFSRLNHPETYVRKCVSDLLCRLAEDTPHLITFPAVVGAVENEQVDLADINFPKSLINDGNEPDGQDYQDNSDNESDKGANDLYSCFLDMVETLSKQAPQTIQQVKLLVKELQRINLLWDELWLGTLGQHHAEFTKRVTQLDREISNVKKNQHLTEEEKTRLIKEKHRLIFGPILFVLEQLNEITSAPPETPHEAYFQKRFADVIAIAINKVKHPTKPEKPIESWTIIKQLQLKFQQRVSKRTSYVLKMSDISPVLANLKNTVISMPGVLTTHNTKIAISSIENNVAILPTKTKPKKLVFYGSDGKPYTYLFKGLEDLHLDERIMQFLSIANTMMSRDSESNDNQTYRARHYSVIPLGPRSGLISWVDNMTPLFVLYKRWQHREGTIAQAKSNKPLTVPRPSELYYNKLTPLLMSANVSVDHRKDWPITILKQVYSELSNETPGDLLARELWCGSTTSQLWWQSVRRYSFSLAVMCMIGYVIGLGDRHLDNVLVDLTSGEVVHIDYNVCFEKGKTLRVPEKVPFRLTPNLVQALGVTGVEGIYRIACENVMKVMRRGRETLLTLLEAFVYDPLVEWGGGAGTAVGVVCSAAAARGTRRKRKQVEIKAAADMLAVRCCEIRHDWNKNRDDIIENLPMFKECIEKWLEQTNFLTRIEENLENCLKQIELIKEVEAVGQNLSKHPLHAISQKYSAYKQTKNEVEYAFKGLVKILTEYDSQIENYISAMDAINGPELAQLNQELSIPNDHDNELIFDAIKEFLHNAGQGSMISQCEQAETELIQSIQGLNNLIRSTLDVLGQYAAVSQYYPQSFSDHNKTIMLRKWLAAALETKSPEMCREVSKQIVATLSIDVANGADEKQITAYNYQLQNANTEATAKLNKAFERLQIEGGPKCTALADEAFNEAKSNLANFLRQDKTAVVTVEFVVITLLCALNRRYLMLESSAQSAGDCLVDLTSREGDWFMEEIATTSSVIIELLTFVPIKTLSHEDENIVQAVNCVKIANRTLNSLNELNFNFQTIILPETIKKIQVEDATMLFTIKQLNEIIINSPCPFNELMAQLEMHFKYLIMEMELPPSNVRAVTTEVRARYEALMNGYGNLPPGSVDAGRMLLMGFDGLFAPLAVHVNELMEVLMSQEIPTAWKKIDHISEAIDMSAPLQNEQVRAVLEDIFFIKKMQVIADVFGMCAQMSSSFQGTGPVVIFDDERLCRPVRRYIADYMSRCFLGVHSRALGSAICLLLRRRGLDITSEVEQKEIGATWKVHMEAVCLAACNGHTVSGGSRETVLVASLDSAARKRSNAYRARRDVERARAGANRLALWSRAHARAHKRVSAANQSQVSQNRALARRATQLDKARAALAQAGQKAHALVKQVHQRLKWGAGANPALATPLAALEAGWAQGAARARQLQEAAVRLARLAISLAPPEHNAQLPTQALAKWEKACVASSKVTIKVEPVEEALMELLHPEGAIDTQWVQNVAALLSDMTMQLEKDLKNGRKDCSKLLEKVHKSLQDVKAIFDQRKSLIGPIKPLLRVLNLSQFTVRENCYEAMWSFVLDSMKSPDVDVALAVLERIDEIIEVTAEIHDDLLRLDVVCSDGNLSRRLMKQATAVPNKASTTKKGESVQGAGVWRRVRLKLEGRDLDPSRRATVHEQVDRIIEEARDIENLSLMYEGWMAWV